MIFPSGADFAWLACDEDGYVAVFTNAGAGPIPVASLALGGLADSAEDLVDELPIVSECDLLVSLPRPDDYVAFARRGLYAYDWSDVHRRKNFTRQYELQARPAKPVSMGQISDLVRRLASAVRFNGIQFACSTRLSPQQQFACVTEQ